MGQLICCVRPITNQDKEGFPRANKQPTPKSQPAAASSPSTSTGNPELPELAAIAGTKEKLPAPSIANNANDVNSVDEQWRQQQNTHEGNGGEGEGIDDVSSSPRLKFEASAYPDPDKAAALFLEYMQVHRNTLPNNAFNSAYSDMANVSSTVLEQLQGRSTEDQSRLTKRLTEFTRRGGRFVLFPEVAEDALQMLPAVKLCRGDTVYPACHAGQNRSQVMWALLKDISRVYGTAQQEALAVVDPHGAESGFDPHRRYNNVTADNFFEFCHGHISSDRQSRDQWMNERFCKALGRWKSHRFGFTEGQSGRSLMPTDYSKADFTKVEADRMHMRHFFDKQYFSVSQGQSQRAGQRQIFFCFMRSLDICLGRLLEANPPGKDARDFGNYCFIGIAWGDPIGNRPTKNASQAELDAAAEETYTKMYKAYGQLVRFVDA